MKPTNSNVNPPDNCSCDVGSELDSSMGVSSETSASFRISSDDGLSSGFMANVNVDTPALAGCVPRLVRGCGFTNWAWSKQEHQHLADWEFDLEAYSCDFLNLLDLKSGVARSQDQKAPVYSHLCRKEIYDNGGKEVLTSLAAILKEIYPDSFLFRVDRDNLQYSKIAPQPLCLADLEVWFAQIRYSYLRIALEIESRPEESIRDICRLFPSQKQHTNWQTFGDDDAKLLGDQAWLGERFIYANVNEQTADEIGLSASPCSLPVVFDQSYFGNLFVS